MNKKLVLAASICVLSGMANASSMPKGSFPIGSTPVEAKGSAQDPCQFNGFYGSIRAGYGITHVKDTITTKPATMSGTVTGFRDNPALAENGTVTQGTLTQGAAATQSTADLLAYNAAMTKLSTLSTQIVNNSKTDATTFTGDASGDWDSVTSAPVAFPATSNIAATSTLADLTADSATGYQEIATAFIAEIGVINANLPTGYSINTNSGDSPITFAVTTAGVLTIDNVKLTTPAGIAAPAAATITLKTAAAPLDAPASHDIYSKVGNVLHSFVNTVRTALGTAPTPSLTQGTAATVTTATVGAPAVTGGEVTAHRGDHDSYGVALKPFSASGAHDNFTFGAQVGYQHTFKNFFAGLEIGGEFTPGTTLVQDIKTNKSTTQDLGGIAMYYQTPVESADPKVELKTQWSCNFTPMIGITSGDWSFYIPVSAKVSNHKLTVTPSNSAGVNLPTVDWSDNNAATYNDTLADAKLTANSGATTSTNAPAAYSKNKTKMSFAVGVGAKVMVSKHCFVGLRYMYDIKSTINVDTPAYETNALHDIYKLGAKHSAAITGHKGTLEIGYKF